MVRVKLPMGGVTPDQLDAFAERDREVRARARATSRPAVHPDAPTRPAHPPVGDAGLSSREGCGNTMRTLSPAIPGQARRGRGVRHHALRGRLRALLRPDYAGDAAVSRPRLRRPTRTTRSPRAGRRPRSRDPRGRCIESHARLAPTLYGSSRVENGDFLKVTEACMCSSTARSGCASTAPGSDQEASLIHKIGIDEFRDLVEELQGASQCDFAPWHPFRPRRGVSCPEPGAPECDNREFNHFLQSN